MIGGVVKIVVNYTLVGNPNIMIYGAPVGTLCCFAIAAALNLLIIKAVRTQSHPLYRWSLSNRHCGVRGNGRPPHGRSTGCSRASWTAVAELPGHMPRRPPVAIRRGRGGICNFGAGPATVISREDLEMMPGGRESWLKILHIQ